MEKVFVSSCLLGAPVRYDGGTKRVDSRILDKWRGEGRLVAMCPEVSAGLSTPRPACEIAPGGDAAGVLSGTAGIHAVDGADMSPAFVRGADLALKVAQEAGCRFALLMDGSPSCGSTFVHAGTFDGRTRAGEGVVSARLRAAGLRVFNPNQVQDLAIAIQSAEKGLS